ncbi:MAG: putative Fe-S cluster assembly protein SufT [Acidimicrobiales bacterium]
MSPPAGSSIVLAHDCPAVLVPSGRAVTLPAGTGVVVVQSLGGSVTVQTDRGHLARVSPGDATELALVDHDADARAPDGGGPFSLDAVTDALRTVYDPEIPINVVDLGLVYACDASLLPDGSRHVEIKMSMTAPGCGMGDVLKSDARRRVAAVPGVGAVDVELVWDPPWDASRLSEDARLELGMW